MRVLCMMALGAFLLFAAANANADLYQLDAGVTLRNAGVELDVGDYAAPEIADWNNDGKPDLVTGYFGSYIRVYLNGGTTTNPALNGYSTISGISLSAY